MKDKILAYGEIMLRLKACDGGIADSKTFEACYGGTEANVLACMSGLGHPTAYLSAIPDTELGQAVMAHLKSFNIDVSNVVVRGDTLGMYFVQDGNGSRGSSVLYLRKHSEFTRLSEGDVDYDKVFCGVGLFHVSGISFALSDSSRSLAYRLMQEARKRNVKISFDFNYRAKLWSVDEARKELIKAAAYADILLASTLDLTTFLQTDEEQLFRDYPCEYLILRDRKALSADEHSVRVKVCRRTADGVSSYIFPERKFPVSEKIGGGDAFDGCILHAILDGQDVRDATLFGVAGFMLKHLQAGDTFSAREREVAELAEKLGAKL